MSVSEISDSLKAIAEISIEFFLKTHVNLRRYRQFKSIADRL